ncbi:MAG: T9SS type A sorting domain-containing protein [Flavobacteriales bacterium]|nr:T9SS type A sorting domain-containing protein [Flavobacteriales bacterium]
MRKIFVIATIVYFALPTLAQQSWQDAEPAPGYYLRDRKPEELMRINEIWKEDFENGIPDTWENTEMNGIAHWEYRGPNTTPDYYIGSRGSCIPEGQNGSAPIQSNTWDNGFIIFDSNYWDDNIGPCVTGFGTGPSPAPHAATLVTESIDLTNYAAAQFMFTQYFKEWTNNSTASVQMSVDGGTWEDVYSVDITSGNSTEPDDVVIIDVSEAAGGHGDVRFQFVFEGSYYYWMIDDVTVFEPDQNNLVFTSTGYGDFDIFDESNETGFEYMEYSMYPDGMAPYLYLNAQALNVGSDTQTNVILDVSVTNIQTQEVLYNYSSSAQEVYPQENQGFAITGYQMPNTIGDYRIDYAVTQAEDDSEPENNVDEKFFSISDIVYAKDDRETEAIYVPSALYDNTQYEVGNMFLITGNDMEAHSISVGVGLGSQNGAEVYGAIYSLEIENFSATELIAQTESQAVYWEALNGLGDENMMVLNFTEPIQLDKDSAYLVVAGCETGGDDVIFAMSGSSEPYSSWAHFFPNNYGYLFETPMVRLNFGEVVGVKEEEAYFPEVHQNFPNPFGEQTAFQYSIREASRVSMQIHDITGRLIQEDQLGVKPAGKHTAFISASGMSPGLYTYTLIAGEYRKTMNMVVE